ncbi:toll-like receptor 13 [Littorina saxatilis]|uniref:toll-like receptor 13 n=1 Tax=Littorina saxatilis TaxID=31220 RepID=UPI0038B4570F
MYWIAFHSAVVLSVVFTRSAVQPGHISHDKTITKAKSSLYVCGENLCRCYKRKANCSQPSHGLHYIPELPNGIQNLIFTHNKLKSISLDSFFSNVTRITEVDLSYNKLTQIRPGAFRNLTLLTRLTLSGNPLNYSQLHPVLSVSSLRSLQLEECRLGTIPRHFFDDADLPRLANITFNKNLIDVVDLDLFAPLKGLKSLYLPRCQISHLYSSRAIQLDVLVLGFNALFSFPKTCSSNGTSLFPSLRKLDLDGNLINFLPTHMCLPQLQLLGLNYNRFESLKTNAFSYRNFPRLEILYLTQMNSFLRYIQIRAFNNPRLRSLYLSLNNINFLTNDVQEDCFANLTRLRRLELSHNKFPAENQKFEKLTGHLSNLENLYLEGTQTGGISPVTFNRFPKLERLYLNRNSISVIPDGVFDNLTRLKHLDLGINQISLINPSTFSGATRNRLKHVDLSHNPFLCSCDLVWFQHWLVSNKSLFDHTWGSYNCSNIPDLQVEDFHVVAQACLLSFDVSMMIIVVISLVLLTLAVIVVVFRYRWHFRLVLYEAFRGHGDARRRRLQTGHFDYDIFVSHDSDDLPWVRRHLMPELEDRLGLRLCLHQRDFTLGRNIVDNIADCVERSKKVMMLFSASFVQSQWCQFELSLCLTHVMDFDDALIIVCLDDVPSRDLTAAMMAVLKTTTYIQWMDDRDAVTSFWGRLRVAVSEILPHNNP